MLFHNVHLVLSLMYLEITQADVFDHMEHILSSLDMFAGIAENLIDYTFNVRHLVHSVSLVLMPIPIFLNSWLRMK